MSDIALHFLLHLGIRHALDGVDIDHNYLVLIQYGQPQFKASLQRLCIGWKIPHQKVRHVFLHHLFPEMRHLAAFLQNQCP